MTQDMEISRKIVEEEYPIYKNYYTKEQSEDVGFRHGEFEFISNTIRNVMFACPTTTFADALTSQGYQVYVYNFDFNFWPELTRDFPIGQLLGKLGDMKVDSLGAFHSSDVPFVMKLFYNRNVTLNEVGMDTPYSIYMAPAFTQPGDSKHAVSDFMSCSWANMAKCGSPSCPSSDCSDIQWNLFDKKSTQYMYIGPSGDLSMQSISLIGNKTSVGESFPSLQKCYWYMDNVQTPFHDLRADLNFPQQQVRNDQSKSSNLMRASIAIILIISGTIL
jgi:carboxylesterase type B